ncbi:MAG: hypothetical protein J3R72DRAFT_494125 [Linnemannia gamsii]|nr:MAG: hypothetical protein J3R72DRAFT_494125 [Linnemannia gamsii]
MPTGDKPTVLIVEAGPRGLMLGALLEKSGVSSAILERVTLVNHSARPMPVSLPVFKQLGIYEELLTISNYIDELAYV